MLIFVDGYNLIFAASRKLEGFDIERTESARDRLLSLLAKFKSVRTDRITVFFDGGPEAAHLPRRQMVRGMDVIFSDVDSDADTEIKNAVSHHAEPRTIRVITSDVAIRNFVKRYGATVTESRDFLQELDTTLKQSALPTNEPMEKYEGAGGDDRDYWLKIFGGPDDKDKH